MDDLAGAAAVLGLKRWWDLGLQEANGMNGDVSPGLVTLY
jgi:hypothetical protein